ncbi:hypothetical protein AAU61_09520 [Desulfocarbo indianensis]|nr:hypothetical protein AAU61_09520 [Desulfocarbo indianensis]
MRNYYRLFIFFVANFIKVLEPWINFPERNEIVWFIDQYCRKRSRTKSFQYSIENNQLALTI